MSINVSGIQMSVSEPLRNYAEEKIGNSLKVMDIDPISCEVVLSVKRNPAIATPCRCEVTLRVKGHVIHVEEDEMDMYAAIDVAAAKVLRQLRKYKTRVIDRRKRAGAREEGESLKSLNAQGGELDLDALMDELSADDEVVRVKEIDFMPLTEEEAMIQIDLLGHDFFAYIDRDSNMPCVLYRRGEGGYGLLKQTN